MKIKSKKFEQVKNLCTKAAKEIPTPWWNMRVPICLQVLRFIVQYRPLPSREIALVVAGGGGRGGGSKGVSEVPHLGDKCVYLPRYHLFPSPT